MLTITPIQVLSIQKNNLVSNKKIIFKIKKKNMMLLYKKG